MIDTPLSLSLSLFLCLCLVLWRHVAVAVKRLQHAPPTMEDYYDYDDYDDNDDGETMARTGDKLDLNSLHIARLSTRVGRKQTEKTTKK